MYSVQYLRYCTKFIVHLPLILYTILWYIGELHNTDCMTDDDKKILYNHSKQLNIKFRPSKKKPQTV